MPQPTLQQVHINRPLTMISTAYLQDPNAFVFDKVFPTIPVDKASDLYFQYQKDSFLRDEAQVRAPATESAGSGYGLTTAQYSTTVWALHDDVPDQVIDNSDTPLEPMADATTFLTQKMLIRQENLWVNSFFKTGVWGTDKVGGTDFTQWSDYSGSDPIADVKAGIKRILSNTGFKPNTLTLGWEVWNILQNHPDFVDRIKYGASAAAPAVVTAQAMAQLFTVDKVLVAEAVQATANEGASTQTYDFILGNNALLSYAPPAPAIRKPSAGYIFYWKGISRGMGTTVGVKDFPMLNLEATRVEVQIAVDMHLVGSDLGYFFSNAAA